MDNVREAIRHLDEDIEVAQKKFCLADREIILVLSQMILSRYNRYAQIARVERIGCSKGNRT